jgi:hypothetical protein
MTLRLQKGRHAHRKYHNARMTGIQLDRYELMERQSVMVRTFRGGYSGWRKLWARMKPSAFEQRFSPVLRPFPQWLDLPVRHPRIRYQGA